MTRQELVHHLQTNKCQAKPIDGINISGWQIKFINKQYPNCYAYVDMPINNKDVPSFVVERICLLLQIPLPKEY